MSLDFRPMAMDRFLARGHYIAWDPRTKSAYLSYSAFGPQLGLRHSTTPQTHHYIKCLALQVGQWRIIYNVMSIVNDWHHHEFQSPSCRDSARSVCTWPICRALQHRSMAPKSGRFGRADRYTTVFMVVLCPTIKRRLGGVTLIGLPRYLQSRRSIYTRTCAAVTLLDNRPKSETYTVNALIPLARPKLMWWGPIQSDLYLSVSYRRAPYRLYAWQCAAQQPYMRKHKMPDTC